MQHIYSVFKIFDIRVSKLDSRISCKNWLRIFYSRKCQYKILFVCYWQKWSYRRWFDRNYWPWSIGLFDASQDGNIHLDQCNLNKKLSQIEIKTLQCDNFNIHNTREFTPHHTSWFSSTKGLDFQEMARDRFNLITWGDSSYD